MLMKKEKIIFNISTVGVQLSILLFGIFAFSFILSEIELVTGDDGYDPLDAVAGEGNHPPSASPNPVDPPTKQGPSPLSKFFGVKEVGGTADALLTGLQWGIVAYGIGQLVGGLLGLESQNVDALSTSLAAGAFVYTGLE